jgi:hypothetical protein
VLGVNSQVILLGRLHKAQPHKEQAKPCKDQARLDERGRWSSFGYPGGQNLGDKAIHSTYSLTHPLSGNFSKEILTEVRAKLGVAHGLPSYQVNSLNLENHQLCQLKLTKIKLIIWVSGQGHFNQISHQQITTKSDPLSNSSTLNPQ